MFIVGATVGIFVSTVIVLTSSSNVVSFTTPGTGLTEFTIELDGKVVTLIEPLWLLVMDGE